MTRGFFKRVKTRIKKDRKKRVQPKVYYFDRGMIVFGPLGLGTLIR
jgi:hypothetical protein